MALEGAVDIVLALLIIFFLRLGKKWLLKESTLKNFA